MLERLRSTSWSMVSVLRVQAADTERPQKEEHEAQALKELDRLARGPYKEQFTVERLADAVAICRRTWSHFAANDGNLPPQLQALPAELAAALRHAGKRSVGHIWGSPEVAGLEDEALQKAASMGAGWTKPRLPRQFTHRIGALSGAMRGRLVPVVARYGSQPKTDEEFAARPAGLGCFVATRIFKSSPMAKLSTRLSEASYWIWRVIRVYQAGDEFDAPVHGKTVATEVCYEAHLYSKGTFWEFRSIV